MLQVLVADLPVSLASVDCNGDETSLLQCTSNGEDLRGCTVPDTNFTDATVLACANTAAGAPLFAFNCTPAARFSTACKSVVQHSSA